MNKQDECNCFECRLLKKYPDFDKNDPPQQMLDEIKSIGGCYYCAGTGQEDYPQNTKPCRLGCYNVANMFDQSR